MTFHDYFSRLAPAYARARPGYPSELFDYLAGLGPARDLAWDAGTGNGQAARALARHFSRVHATDASAEQLRLAEPHDRVAFRQEPAESVSLSDRVVDLVTSAVAVHWFDFSRFYSEVRRVLKPDGAIAVWTYHLPHVDERVDAAILQYYRDVLDGFWPERIRYVHERYRTLPFPFSELPPPVFEMSTSWTLEQLAGFLASWSAAPRYQEVKGQHPLEAVWDGLSRAWGGDGARVVRWELCLRVGRPGPGGSQEE